MKIRDIERRADVAEREGRYADASVLLSEASQAYARRSTLWARAAVVSVCVSLVCSLAAVIL